MRSTVYVRNFESTLRLLAERGHHVHVAAEPYRALDHADLMGRLCRECPGITHGIPPPSLDSRWSYVGYELRRGIDYLRYLEPEYRHSPKLRQRAEVKAPGFLKASLPRRLSATRLGRQALVSTMRAAGRAVPTDAPVEAFIRAQRPDLVVVTPLVEPGSPQSAYVRAAQALGIRTALCVYSWDNLTNKGLIHDSLDVVTVWNEAMRDEAVRLHRVPAQRVVATGAAAYDHWFGWKPGAVREQFCRRVGLDASRPYILYLCSSGFIAPDELPFVERWITEVRASSETLRRVGVLVRPHPQNIQQWRDADLSGRGNVAVWPRESGNPIDADSRADYFDSIYHSAAVVGINTSAQIESAIVGRGVYTVLAPEFQETQTGTLHFHHLQHFNGGLLHVASNMGEHAAGLEAAVRAPERAAERGRRFVEAFVRPFGVGEPAAPRVVAALEAAAERGARRPLRAPWWAAAMRPALERLVPARESEGRPDQPRRVKPPRTKAPARRDVTNRPAMNFRTR